MKPRITGSALSLALWLATPLLAGQFVPMSIEQLTQRAQIVLQGTVRAKNCQRDAAGRIYTQLELDVREVLKGAVPTGRFTIVHGGGAVGQEKAVVAGQVDYLVGEEVFAFLVLNQRGEGVTVGLIQGKFTVWTHPKTGEKLAWNPFYGQPKMGQHPAQVQGSVSLPERLSLAELKQRVKGVSR